MALLEMRNITKLFPGVVANDRVNLLVEEGETHALLGENGAGKSTLMNILYGMYPPSSGEVLLRGKPVHIRSARHAIELGIGMVHQHFMLIPALTVAENMVLGMNKSKVLNLEKAAEEVKRLAAAYHMEIDPHLPVWQLSVGQQQRVEIIKALYRGADLLILDEPTAVLTPGEVGELFGMIRRLTDEGHTVIFISHKLAEVMEICTRCTVLRQGKLAATVSTCDIADKEELARLMVGHEVKLATSRPPAQLGDTVLRVENLDALGNQGLPALRQVNFSLRAGEILGVAGVDGNGQSELVECLTGHRKIEAGEVQIGGVQTTCLRPRQILEKGVSHIPEDRHKMGMAAEMSVKENLIMMAYYKEPYAKHGFLHWNWITRHSEELCKEYGVKTPSVEEKAGLLSGGNQQKFVVGREIERKPRLLVAMHPARGLDIGATKYIQQRIMEERSRGAAVLLISTELDEILEMSDRILVMYEGRVMAILEAETASRQEIGLLMAGGGGNPTKAGLRGD